MIEAKPPTLQSARFPGTCGRCWRIGTVLGALWLVALTGSCESPTDSLGSDGEWSITEYGGAAATPYVDEDLVVFGAFESTELYALDRRTGETIWEISVPVPGGFPYDGFFSALTIHRFEDLLIVQFGFMHAIDRNSGRIVWSLEWQGNDLPGFTSTLHAGRLIGAGRRLYEIDPRMGTILREHDVVESDEFIYRPSLDGGVVYFGTTAGRSGHVMALELESSSVIWRQLIPEHPTGPWNGGVAGEGVLTNDAFIVAARNKRVYAFDRWTGEERWMFEGKGGPYRSRNVVRVGDLVAVGGSGGWVEAIDLDTGALRWSADVVASVGRGMAATDSVVLVGNGRVRAFDQEGGKIWGFGGAGWNQPIISPAPAYLDGVVYATSLDLGIMAIQVPF